MTALRQTGLTPPNAVLSGDRKLCNQETMRGFCRMGQQFLAAHPWTQTAQGVWRDTWQQLQAGTLAWTPVAYTPRNAASKSLEQRPQWQVCEVAHELKDPSAGTVYPLRWVFSFSSTKAQQEARQKTQAI